MWIKECVPCILILSATLAVPPTSASPRRRPSTINVEELGIEFARVDHDHADTMEDCLKIESILGAKICKNLFLCNRQQTEFYLLMMPGDKPFKTKFLSAQLGCSRLSFADENHMRDYLSTIPAPSPPWSCCLTRRTRCDW